MKDLIAWGQGNPTQVISLEDLTTTIFASRSSIVHSCRASFGMGPMTLLKQIRLGQVQAVLLNPQRRESMGLSTVQAVATHFGFSSRNHFARDYRQLFGEAPSETLQRPPRRESAPTRCPWPTGPRWPWPAGSGRHGRCSQR